MKYYGKLLSLGCFTIDDAVKLIGSEQATLSLLKQYAKKGYITKIRRGLYSAINLYDNEPVVNRFEVASALSETSVVSHHSAFEFYGYANQVSYSISVTSDTKFNPFSFGAYRYVRYMPSTSLGVQKIGSRLRVTDIERTVIDGINDFEKNMGFEELIHCIRAVPILNEDKLVRYLSEYKKCFLYQKVGFILNHLQNEFGISDGFLELCRRKAGQSSRYLIKEMKNGETDYSSFWHLTIPKDLWRNVEGGADNADI